MPQLAQRLGVNVEHLGFAARLGRLPQPLGRDADGLLLFDADAISLHLENPETASPPWPRKIALPSLGARTDATGNDTSRTTWAGCA